MRALALWGCTWIAAAALLGCKGTEDHRTASSNEPVDEAPAASTKLRIGVTPHCATAPAFAARDGGAFRREGIEATFVRFEDGKQALSALRRGEVDVALAGDLPTAVAAMKGDDVRLLATVAHSEYADWIVARVGVATAADLRGKTVGVPRHAGARFVLDAVLRHVGLREDDVTLRFASFPELRHALAAGKIDALVVQQPLRRSVQALFGPGFSTITDHGGYRVDVNAVTTATTNAGRGDVVKAFLRALDEGVAAAAHDPAPYAKTIEAELGKIDPADDPIASECGRVRFGLGLHHELAHKLAREAAWFVSNGSKQRPFDVKTLIDVAPLTAVRPDVVAIQR
ncbi:MAG TPA: ABC transporter substrate-binding protein [Minicystis sp.]|nr:ABC transporter substrate-binding protein [Minicystis sp.]